MKIEDRPINEVFPYLSNPRRNEKAIAFVADSIRNFGFRQPIVVDSEGVIIAGHTRFEAAKELGLATVPVHVAEGLSEDDIKAYRIADNKTAEFAEWDESGLRSELERLKATDYDLAKTAFTPDELTALLYPELPPEDFAGYDEDIETEHQCPKCGYTWS